MSIARFGWALDANLFLKPDHWGHLAIVRGDWRLDRLPPAHRPISVFRPKRFLQLRNPCGQELGNTTVNLSSRKRIHGWQCLCLARVNSLGNQRHTPISYPDVSTHNALWGNNQAAFDNRGERIYLLFS